MEMDLQPYIDSVSTANEESELNKAIESFRYDIIGNFESGAIPSSALEVFLSGIPDPDKKLAILLGCMKLHEKYFTMNSAVTLQNHEELWDKISEKQYKYLQVVEVLHYSADPASEVSRLLAWMDKQDWDYEDFSTRRSKISEIVDKQNDSIYHNADTPRDRAKKRYTFEDENYVASFIKNVGEKNIKYYSKRKT